MRWAASLPIAILALALSACAAHSNAHHSTTSTRPDVVDGITVPPVYVTPAGTVVPGPSTCPSGFAATLSAEAAGTSFTASSQQTAHLITCTYQAAAAPPSSCSRALILINTEPQAFVAFNRWNVETGQNSMWTNNPALRPTPVPGIGIEAEWVPALLELGAGNDTTWVSVTLTCPGNSAGVLELAEQLATQGLAATA